MRIGRAVRPFVPPVLWDLAARVAGRPLQFVGDYSSWEQASADAQGYDSEEILHRVLASTRKVAAGEAKFERDGVAFDNIEYSWPLLACLLQVALERRSLHVIDFGGSLGSTWRQNSVFLNRLDIPLTWNVVEQPHFVEAGRKEFSDDVLRFHSSITAAAQDGVDVVLFCSSLCYVESPDAVLRETIGVGAPFIIIDRLPLVTRDRDRIALQIVGEPIYKASYPIRFFSQRTILEDLLRDWRLIERWGCDLQPHSDSESQGFFLERR